MLNGQGPANLTILLLTTRGKKRSGGNGRQGKKISFSDFSLKGPSNE